ncbi:MAG: DUF368 domain-containing protein [Bacteroidales bacterium]|nr:DUF368 domain-containing protein [Bacteroidales bacterium]
MKNLLSTFLKGLGMGAADVIPGVSGGTIAFITGIYERLIGAIKSINFSNIKLFFTGHFKEFWKNIDGTFLVCLIAGIGVSFITLAKLMTFLLIHHPISVWSFFFGLIIASTLFVGKDVKWNWKTILVFIVFTIISYFVTSPGNAPLSSDHENWYIFICGAIAICAMILPGISGSFILVLLGEYMYMLDCIANFKILPILLFLAGAVLGLLSFANLLSWLFKHFKMITLAALTGFMLGSLNKIWPWKKVLTIYLNKDGFRCPLTEINLLPSQYNGDPHIGSAIALMVIGFSLIFVIEYIAKKVSK